MENNSGSEKFRDSIATINEKGNRIWIYPKRQKGKYYTSRTIVSVFLLIFLFLIPGIKVNGHPFILLNIFERKFILFGFAFGPQDFYLFVLATIVLFIFIILFTAVYGRLFCGWICPQTIFMEMVFRKIEYFIEGDSEKQMSLNKSQLGIKKFLKKFIKHLIFACIAFIIANTLITYLVGLDDLLKLVNDSPVNNMTPFIAMASFTIGFYLIFSRFREQACTIVCPYGRLQGVLLDPNSLVVAYDYVRGEPRGIFRKGKERKIGDCIDCKLCVKVCPTGIDIRNGTQLECVNCTACIDACNMIMEKVKLPQNLIRYDSMNGIKGITRKKFTPRVIIYTILLGILFTVFVGLMFSRKDISTSVLRQPGMLYQEQPGNKISNLYTVKLVNNTFSDVEINLKLNNPDAELKLIGKELMVPSLTKYEAEFLVIIPKEKIKFANTNLKIEVYSDDEKIDELKTNFLGPSK